MEMMITHFQMVYLRADQNTLGWNSQRLYSVVVPICDVLSVLGVIRYSADCRMVGLAPPCGSGTYCSTPQAYTKLHAL